MSEIIEYTPPQSGLVRPVAQPAELITYHEEVTQIIQKALKLGTDYGSIPGTDKLTLLKPGAERLSIAFGAAPEYEVVGSEIDHDRAVTYSKKRKVWNNKYQGDRTFTMQSEEGTSLGLYRYVIKCRLVRQGRVLAEGIGTCSTLESKYIDRPRDCENTVMKMAQKRAFVGAVLNAFGLSDRFTQDVEDHIDHTPAPAPKTAPNYNNASESDRSVLADILAKKGVADKLDAVGAKLHGKPASEIDNVIKSLG